MKNHKSRVCWVSQVWKKSQFQSGNFGHFFFLLSAYHFTFFLSNMQTKYLHNNSQVFFLFFFWGFIDLKVFELKNRNDLWEIFVYRTNIYKQLFTSNLMGSLKNKTENQGVQIMRLSARVAQAIVLSSQTKKFKWATTYSHYLV